MIRYYGKNQIGAKTSTAEGWLWLRISLGVAVLMVTAIQLGSGSWQQASFEVRNIEATDSVVRYSQRVVNESTRNDGTIDDEITITLSGGEEFAAEDYMIPGTHYTIDNVPSGLVPLVRMVDSVTAELVFLGSAVNADSGDDVVNIEISFFDDVFSGGNAAAVAGSTESEIEIDFIDTRLAYSKDTLSESTLNNGTISETVTITLYSDSVNEGFSTGLVTNGWVQVDNVPEGMTTVITRDDSKQLTLELTGTATNHEQADDVVLLVKFSEQAFKLATQPEHVDHASQEILVDFSDELGLVYEPTVLAESSANDGTIKDQLVITLTGDNFSSNVISSGYVDVANIPAGLTAFLSRESGNRLALVLLGAAEDHEDEDDVSNVSVTFSDGAFLETIVASNVSGYSKNDIVLDFNNSDITNALIESGYLGAAEDSSTPYDDYFGISTTNNGEVTQVSFLIELAKALQTLDTLGLSPETSALLTPLITGFLYQGLVGNDQLFKEVPTGDLGQLTGFTGATEKDLVTQDGICLPISFATLQRGDRGSHVMRLQRHLWALGYGVEPDGVYGASTADAVKFFQLEFGLAADGVSGPRTITALELASCGGPVTRTAIFQTNADAEAGQTFCDFQTGLGTLEQGSSQGLMVRTVQQFLSSLGFFSGVANGTYGPATTTAVTNFQATSGVTPDGKVGPGTFTAMTDRCPSVEVIDSGGDTNLDTTDDKIAEDV